VAVVALGAPLGVLAFVGVAAMDGIGGLVLPPLPAPPPPPPQPAAHTVIRMIAVIRVHAAVNIDSPFCSAVLKATLSYSMVTGYWRYGRVMFH
jgi:hypothetical protein